MKPNADFSDDNAFGGYGLFGFEFFPIPRYSYFIELGGVGTGSKPEKYQEKCFMDVLQEVEQLLSKMTRAEKAQVLQWVVRDLGEAFPGIESTPGVCGGEPCIVRTRTPVWVLVQARRLGASEADLLHSYPGMRSEDLASAWAYSRLHRDEIEQQIEENETA